MKICRSTPARASARLVKDLPMGTVFQYDGQTNESVRLKVAGGYVLLDDEAFAGRFYADTDLGGVSAHAVKCTFPDACLTLGNKAVE